MNIFIGVLFLICGSVAAQTTQTVAAGNVWAAPMYTPADFIERMYRHWGAPQAVLLTRQTAALNAQIAAVCAATPANAASALQAARTQWRDSVTVWQALSAIAIGPLVERRSLRQIDFSPTRPELITRAVQRAPTNAQDMESIGAPAKGFPALEWLLWAQPVKPGSAECRYAEQVAADLDREAQALARAFAEATEKNWRDEDEDNARETNVAFSEWLNQWVGGIERLRWTDMARPVLEANSKSRSAARFPRVLSKATQSSWASAWQNLRSFSIAPNAQAEAEAGNHGPVAIEAYLRGLGNAKEADQLRRLTLAADRAMQGLSPQSPARVQRAAKALADLKRYVEAEVAQRLNVNIGFSDADGD